MFRTICAFMANRVWLTRIALFEEMYTRICGGEWTADLVLQGIVSEMAQLPADLVGILTPSGGLQWLLTTYARSYVTVTLSIGKKAVTQQGYDGCYTRRTAKSTKKLWSRRRCC
jgi:hypothetical protein